MSNYRPFLMQKLTTGAPIRDSTEWDIYVKHVPFKPIGDLKEPYTQDWADENGNDVYYPATPVYKAYDMECEFVYVGDPDTARAMFVLFIRYLVEGGMFKFYDTYTTIGRTNVNYKSCSPDLFYNEEDKNVASMKITFTANDPVTVVNSDMTT